MKRVFLPLTLDTIKSLKAHDKVLLNGKIITGRDATHKRLVELINNNEELPINIKNETIYYVGPCPKKEGIAVNSCGPTTSSRMDLLSPTLIEHGLIGMIGKGNRSEAVVSSMKKYNGIYFAAIGGAGALYAKSVKSSKVIAFDDLGTEAIHEFEVVDFPVIVAIDSEGKAFIKMEQKLIEKALKTAYKKFIKNKEIEIFSKGEKDFVSNIDKAIELYLIDIFKKHFPSFSFISEEFNPDLKELDKIIVIDPIDGTCNFINGLSLYGIQVAFIVSGEIVTSAIYLPHFDEFYFASKGKGAFLNGKRLLNDRPVPINNAVVSVGDFSRNDKSTHKTQVKIIDNLKDEIMKIKMFGSASIDMAFVSSKKTNGYISFATNIWDYASGILLARESGLIVKSLEEDSHSFFSKSIVIADSNELADLIKQSARD